MSLIWSTTTCKSAKLSIHIHESNLNGRAHICFYLKMQKDLSTWLKSISLNLCDIVIKSQIISCLIKFLLFVGYSLFHRTRKTLSNIGTVGTSLKDTFVWLLCACCISTVIHTCKNTESDVAMILTFYINLKTIILISYTKNYTLTFCILIKIIHRPKQSRFCTEV